jgi:hypothetical protein
VIVLAGATNNADKSMVQLSTTQVSIELAKNKPRYLSPRLLNTANKPAKIAMESPVQSRLFWFAPLVG